MQILLQESIEGPHWTHVLSSSRYALHGYPDCNKRPVQEPRTLCRNSPERLVYHSLKNARDIGAVLNNARANNQTEPIRNTIAVDGPSTNNSIELQSWTIHRQICSKRVNMAPGLLRCADPCVCVTHTIVHCTTYLHYINWADVRTYVDVPLWWLESHVGSLCRYVLFTTSNHRMIRLLERFN